MRNLIKIIFGSCLGVLLAILVIGLIGTVITSTFISSNTASPTVKKNSVLKLTFERTIPEKTNNTPYSPVSLGEELFIGTHDIVENIKAAKADRNIKGIYLNIPSGSMGNAKAKYIRDALSDFKESGKFIYSYSDDYGYHQGAYYLSTVADQVNLHPLGIVDFRGFGSSILFFKDMLDKLGVKMQPFYAGKFKGATEPFRRNDLSEENRHQIKTYVNELYASFIDDIADSRGTTATQLRATANELGGRSAKLALESGLVDALKYEDEVFADLRDLLDIAEGESVPMITLEDYHKSRKKDRNLGAPSKIAILHAEGEIRNGEETYGMITDDHYVDMIRKIGKDEKVKALVLRVNSPGGDAFVSDEIWRALEVLKDKDIKVIASMADVAASGGYYIACGADKIMAEPNTITGSIGVFGLIPNAAQLMNEKLGLHVDTVKTARYATGLVNPFYPIGEKEAALVQESVNHTYEVFLSRVAEGRKMTRDEVHEIAQGRVWTGRKAIEIGLIDELGDLDQAISEAARMAGIEDYRLTEYPRIKDPMQKLIEDLRDGKLVQHAGESFLKAFAPKTTQAIAQLESILHARGPQARLPFVLAMD